MEHTLEEEGNLVEDTPEQGVQVVDKHPLDILVVEEHQLVHAADCNNSFFFLFYEKEVGFDRKQRLRSKRREGFYKRKICKGGLQK